MLRGTRAGREGVSLTPEAKPWGMLTISTAGCGAWRLLEKIKPETAEFWHSGTCSSLPGALPKTKDHLRQVLGNTWAHFRPALLRVWS